MKAVVNQLAGGAPGCDDAPVIRRAIDGLFRLLLP